jgi:hypothetical protein
VGQNGGRQHFRPHIERREVRGEVLGLASPVETFERGGQAAAPVVGRTGDPPETGIEPLGLPQCRRRHGGRHLVVGATLQTMHLNHLGVVDGGVGVTPWQSVGQERIDLIREVREGRQGRQVGRERGDRQHPGWQRRVISIFLIV